MRSIPPWAGASRASPTQGENTTLSERNGHGETVTPSEPTPSEQEMAVRMATMRSAANIMMLCAFGMGAYAWASPNATLRTVTTAMMVLALGAGLGVRRLPAERMVG